MEGRWAKLTLRAHLSGKLDVTKPIKGFIENAILAEIELDNIYKLLQITPVINDEGDLVYTRADLIDTVRECILPWLQPKKSESSYDRDDLEAKAAFLKELNAQTEAVEDVTD